MFADLRFTRMEPVRAAMTTVVAPIQWLVSLPSDLLSWGNLTLSDQQALLDENQRLRQRILLLSHRGQRVSSLREENHELRRLLQASRPDDIPSISAELLSLDNDPFSHRMVLDQGFRQGAYVGQPVIDAFGLVGQVTAVSMFSSRVLLVGDANHALPIQVNRNGLRFIAQGTGNNDLLEVLHVPDTADLREGDLLTTSGLGGRFPPGYPVARVVEIVHDPGEPFAKVSAVPQARLDRSRHFLLLFPPRAEDAVDDDVQWRTDPDPSSPSGDTQDGAPESAFLDTGQRHLVSMKPRSMKPRGGPAWGA